MAEATANMSAPVAPAAPAAAPKKKTNRTDSTASAVGPSLNTAPSSKSAAAPQQQVLNKQPRLETQGAPRIILEQDYFVEHIRDKDIKESRVMYQIQWRGYPDPRDFTWEPIENIRTCVEHIADFERRIEHKQAKNPKINLKLVEVYRDGVFENDTPAQFLGYDTVKRVLFLRWDNSMVTTLHIEEIDSNMLYAFASLNVNYFATKFEEKADEIKEKVEIEKKKLIENPPAPDELIPSDDELVNLARLIEGTLTRKRWIAAYAEDDTERSNRYLLNPQTLLDRIPGDERDMYWYTQCDNCGAHFERPNIAFFKHLLERKHNGSYLKE